MGYLFILKKHMNKCPVSQGKEISEGGVCADSFCFICVMSKRKCMPCACEGVCSLMFYLCHLQLLNPSDPSVQVLIRGCVFVSVPVGLKLVQTEEVVASEGQHQLLQPVTQLLREVQQLHALYTQEKQISHSTDAVWAVEIMFKWLNLQPWLQ